MLVPKKHQRGGTVSVSPGRSASPLPQGKCAPAHRSWLLMPVWRTELKQFTDEVFFWLTISKSAKFCQSTSVGNFWLMKFPPFQICYRVAGRTRLIYLSFGRVILPRMNRPRYPAPAGHRRLRQPGLPRVAERPIAAAVRWRAKRRGSWPPAGVHPGRLSAGRQVGTADDRLCRGAAGAGLARGFSSVTSLRGHKQFQGRRTHARRAAM